MTKTLNELQKEFETLVSNNQNEIRTVTEKLELKKKEVTSLQTQLKKAEQDINIDKFEKVNKELWVAKQTIKMLETKLNDLQTEPLISKEQMNLYENGIKATTEEQRESARAAFNNVKEEIKKAILLDLDARVKGQQLLDDLVSKIVRNNKQYFLAENGTLRGMNLYLNNRETTLDYEVQEFIREVLK